MRSSKVYATTYEIKTLRKALEYYPSAKCDDLPLTIDYIKSECGRVRYKVLVDNKIVYVKG